MEENFSFVREVSNSYKLRVVVFSLISFIVLFGSVFAVIQTFGDLTESVHILKTIKDSINEEVTSLSPTGLFYSGFGGGLFFLPLAQELFFYWGLLKGNPIFLSFLTVNAGYFLAQGINYFIGSKLNKIFIHLVSKKRVYKSRRFINKYGTWGVLLFNFFPLPAPLLTFALGIAKYNIYKLFFYTLIGTVLKYGFLIGFFLATT